MNRIANLLFSITLLIFVFSSVMCNKSAEEEYKSAIDSYVKDQKDVEKKDKVLNSLFVVVSSASFPTGAIYSRGQNCIVLKQEKSFLIMTPASETYEVQAEPKFAAYDIENKILSVSDGINADIIAFSADDEKKKDGKKLFNFIMSTGKDEIKAMGVKNRRMYYYLKNKIFYLDVDTMANEPLVSPKKEYKPPFEKNAYTVGFVFVGNLVSVVVGNAGLYNFSVYNTLSNTELLVNKNISTSAVYLAEDKCVYISGSTADWSAKEYVFSTKQEKVLKKFSALGNFFFSGNRAIYLEKGELCITKIDFSAMDSLSPFGQFDILQNYVIINYKNRAYISLAGRFFDEINNLSATCPSVFEGLD